RWRRCAIVHYNAESLCWLGVFGLSRSTRPAAANLSLCRFLLVALQNLRNRRDRVPVAGRRRRTEHFVELAKIADRLHMAAVNAKAVAPLRRYNPQKPFALFGKAMGSERRRPPSDRMLTKRTVSRSGAALPKG